MEIGIVFAFSAALGFGFNQILVRIATQRVPAPAAALLSASTGLVMAGTLALVFHREAFGEVPLSAIPWYLLLATLHHPLARTLNFTAISMVGASRAVPFNSVSPLFAAVLAILILGERPSPILYAGTLVVALGMTLVVTGGRVAPQPESQTRYNRLGYVLAVAAGCGFGAVSIVASYINANFSPALVTVTFSQLLGSLLLGLGAHRPLITTFRQEERRARVPVAILAGMCAGAGAICFFSALAHAPVTVVVPISFASPLVTFTISAVFLRRLENVNGVIALGTASVVAGVVLVVLGRA